ncbi:MAG: hypothetical protein ACFE78_11325 [Candidatus Hodarchaeota archaeon]
MIKSKRKTNQNQIFLWIQRHKDFKKDIQQILQFFKDQIVASKKRKILPYYRITSNNPAILLSLFSAIQDLIPEIFFNEDTSMEIKESINH